MHILGLDIGGTKMEAIVVSITSDKTDGALEITNPKGDPAYISIHKRERIPTQRERGYAPVLNDLSALCLKVIKESGFAPEEIHAIGAGMPGSVHPETGKMINGNSQIFIDKNFKEDLLQKLRMSVPFHLDNDANLFALGETLAGAGLDYARENNKNVFDLTTIGIILGTGVGGGIIIKGHPLSGKSGGGGEIGHTELHSDGLQCYCGRKGCVESYLSGSGVEIAFDSKKTKSSKEIFEQALKGDEKAQNVLNEYRKNLALFLTDLTNIFDPHLIILGGGVSNQVTILDGLSDKVAENCFLKKHPPIIMQHRLGDSAGVIGATLLPLL